MKLSIAACQFLNKKKKKITSLLSQKANENWNRRIKACFSKLYPKHHSIYHKFLFCKQQKKYKSDNCQFVAPINMERFCTFTHFYAASYLIKRCFMKLATFFILSTRRILRNLLGVSECSLEIKVTWNTFH